MLFFAEGEGFLGEFEAREGDLFAVSVHVEFVGEFFEIEFEALFADLGAFGKIGEALESEELGSGLIARFGEVESGLQNGVVGFIGRGGFAGVDGVEFGEAERFSGRDARIDFLQPLVFIAEAFQRAAGNLEAESSIGARFADAFENGGVGFGAEPFSDLIDLRLGEGGEGDFVFS